MFSNRISSVCFSSVFALLLGACLLLPNNGYAAAVGDLDCSGSVDISDAVMIIGLILGYAEPVDCDPAEICDITSDNQAIADTAYAAGALNAAAYAAGAVNANGNSECEEACILIEDWAEYFDCLASCLASCQESPVSGADLCGGGTEWDEGLQQCVGVESINCFQSGFCDEAAVYGYGNGISLSGEATLALCSSGLVPEQSYQGGSEYAYTGLVQMLPSPENPVLAMVAVVATLCGSD